MYKLSTLIILSTYSLFVQAQVSNEVQGTRTGQNITTGDYNVMYGDDSGGTIDVESRNVIVGYRACVGELDDGVVSGNPDPGDGSLQPVTLQDCDVSESVIIGYHANQQGTGGTDNVIIGSQAGTFNSSTDATFVGSGAGEFNTTGSDNVFIGEEAGRNNTTGNDNVFVGEDAGYDNTTASDNTAIGNQALRSNQVGEFNTAVGNEAGWDIGGRTTDFNATRNTVVGNVAGIDIGDGVGNTCLGSNACENTEFADFNTFVGLSSGSDNNRNNVDNDNNAQRNTGLGTYAGYTNREGSDNVWIGAFSDSGRRLGSFNHEIEVLEMQNGIAWIPGTASSSVGADNTIFRTTVLGAFASAGENDSIAIGYNSRSDNLNSIAIGTNTEATFTNSIALGNGATTKANNTVVIGNNTTVAQTPNIDALTSLGNSTYRYADVVSNQISVNAPLTTGARINLAANAATDNADQWSINVATGGDLSVTSFATGADVNLFSINNTGDAVLAGDLTLNSDERLKKNIQPIKNALELLDDIEGKTYQWKDSAKGGAQSYGLIAQQVESVIPELVKVKDDGMKTVNYQGLIPVLVNAINEMNHNTKHQEQLILSLEEKLERQSGMIEELLDRLDQIND